VDARPAGVETALSNRRVSPLTARPGFGEVPRWVSRNGGVARTGRPRSQAVRVAVDGILRTAYGRRLWRRVWG
jgi:hypothetical protein